VQKALLHILMTVCFSSGSVGFSLGNHLNACYTNR